MQIKIDFIKETQRTGQYGPYTLMSVQSGTTTYSSIKKQWNSGWAPGMTVEADVVPAKNGPQLKPPGGVQTFSQPQAQVSGLADLAMSIAEVLREVKQIKSMVTPKSKALPTSDEVPPPTDDDMPPDLNEPF